MTHRNDMNCSIHVTITNSAFLWCCAVPTVGGLGESSAKSSVYSPGENWSIDAVHYRDALRVSLSTFAARRTPQAMVKSFSRSAMRSENVDRLTEPAIIT